MSNITLLRRYQKPLLVICVFFVMLKLISDHFNAFGHKDQMSLEAKETLRKDLSNNTSNTTHLEIRSSAFTENEVTHVVFLKVHKTASSTVQNIFLRFGDHRNLVFMMASVKHNECATGHSPHCISFLNSITDRNIIPPPRNRKYEIMCSHVIYNKERFKHYFQSDTKYVSLVREPVSRLASAISYFDLLKGVKLSRYADDPIKYDHMRLNNGMSFEFGYNKELFLSANHRNFSQKDLEEIDKYTQDLSKDFSLIMITERLPESLVLLKRMLNWKTQDILISRKITGRYDSSFSSTDISKLKTFLKLDFALYDMAVRELDLKIQKTGPGFQEEVAEFIAINDEISKYCKLKRFTKDGLVIKSSNRHPEFKVTRQFCADLTIDESNYFRHIRIKQYGTLNTA